MSKEALETPPHMTTPMNEMIDPTKIADGNETPVETGEPTVLYETADGKITTQEDLIKYVKKLEETSKNKEVTSETITPPPKKKETTKTTDNAQFGELIFNDPDAAAALLEDRIMGRFEEKNLEKKREANFWESFYVKYPDLKPFDKVVKLNVRDAELWEEIKDLNVDQGHKVLGEKTRLLINKIKGSAGGKEETLSNDPVAVLTSTQGQPPQIPQRQEPTNMVAQLKKFRSSKK